MRILVRKALLAVAGIATLLALTACGTGSNAAAATDPIDVVTSTNVWGDVAEQIGGDQVAVSSLIADPAADPHSFEPSAQAQLALSKAALVVENGGGYDDFMQTMLRSATTGAPVIDAVQVSGKQPVAGELNEHVWYDLPTAGKVAARIAGELTTIRPEQAALFQANLATFTDRIAGLTAATTAIKAGHAGAGVAITEPVPLYLTDAAGLVDKTPEQFSKAIEDGTDVPPTVLSDTLELFTGRQVVVLVYNTQTSSPQTDQVLAAAKDNQIPAVGVTETLPAGQDYLSWMDANIMALAGALRG
jgi:zinc/manganese transport system substrate-binding protein